MQPLPTPIKDKRSPTSIEFPEELKAAIDTFATEHNISRSAAVRYMCSVFLKSNNPKWIENSGKVITEETIHD